MLRFEFGLALLCMGVFTVGASAQTVIDDFSSFDPANYTATVILDTEVGSASNTTTFAVNAAGALEVSTTGYDSIEQIALIRNGLTINVGEAVYADFTHFGTSANSRNIGLYVGHAAPIPVTAAVNDPRSGSNYISLYGQSTNLGAFQRGFNALGEYTLVGAAPVGDFTGTYFIERLDADTYVNGFLDDGALDGSGRTIISTITVNGANGANGANFVGIYIDVREDGITGSVDNLRIVTSLVEDFIGDVNMDGAVNFLDIAPFIEVLSTPGLFLAEADINSDGAVTFLDIQPFIVILAGL